ncbi:unnamed protein product [Aphanomyces euteiches]|uniref:Uncharacterized protein n=1 Tax=Aphanomyces euteiches TaxID=100861 RepID=A0A6G0X8Z8_9STRA|nr:hypothetical protein Ae201684_007531 [Aphanomyces euteiches]KAH9101139.1 hypothetical protein Ae201684P_007324 [Aphanomyces euteiches]KAH9103625.1 hypothetical protein AeMF1_020081 [Aphanomyces euteiches]KAH9132067.1 hypothetical protein AeRB84_021429 [Aphanomyces euteiches]KAH9163862.1 hypothetical protein LEN26_000309 [Aphanomyces euteiches]
MDVLRSPSHEGTFGATPTAEETSATTKAKPTQSRMRRMLKQLFVLPTIRFALGAVFGATATVTICFFPFPKGKYFSFICAPIALAFAFLLDKYTNTSVCMVTTAIKVIQRKASFTTAWVVYLGMYFGASYIIDQFQHAIDTSPPKDRQYMELVVEKLYFAMNETVSSRLQQTTVVTAFFYGFDHALIRVVLHSMALIWLVLLPEMNPAIAMGFFGNTKALDGEDRARFWVNFVFLVVSCVVFAKVCELILRVIQAMTSKSKPKQN